MKFNDAIFGIFFILFAIAIIAYAQLTFPPLHGQNFDSRDFPTLIGIGLIVCGVILIFNGLEARSRGQLVGAAFVSLSDWIRTHSLVVNFISLVCGIVFVMLVIDHIGFVISSFLLLCLMLFRLGSPIWISAVCSAAATALVYWLFAVLLRVPLPLGPFGF